ncbi:DnaB-like helicase C-terminal domain-containing protein [Mycoplasmopsis verecunda]|uniref:Replicative DNA helicase n=1 Tax=Mycoplasmopsis verecunda TaxID=171291 RepID=A0A1T4LC60_9BACT|nr:DnaB-like helicase C-terminal domain-containing protein [Mycoplasmopsis verecunda]WPB54812.1 DnaB-like helicase C-terminal domain-containing protein [Mycoplasmopsis verecunda]SJZ52223.1 replicative DNA helicase [Mycoplasmopsis verecunda]
MSRSKRFFEEKQYNYISGELVPLKDTLFHDESVEREVLSNMFNDLDKQSLGFDYLTPQAFYNIAYQQLFKLVKQTRSNSNNKTITFDYNDVKKLIETHNTQFEYSALNIAILNKITSSFYNEDNFVNNIEKLIDLQKMRNLESFYTEYLKSLGQNKVILWDKSIQDLQNFLLSNNNMSIKNSEFIPLDEAAMQLAERINSILQNNAEEQKYLYTGFYSIDKYIKGFKPGQLIILAARPGVGKTALALNIAKNIVDEANMKNEVKNVAFISLEMPTSELTSRYLSTSSGIELYKIQNPKLINSGDEALKLFHTIENMKKDSVVWFDDEPKSNISEIIFKIRHLMKNLEGKLDLVVIDYLQLLSGDASGNRQTEVAAISRSLKTLALELKIPIIALSQLSRSVENREDKRPQLSDLRESGQIEQDADIVLFLSRKPLKKGISEEESNKNEHIPVVLTVAKNRNGQPFVSETLIYTGKYVKFTDEKEGNSY